MILLDRHYLPIGTRGLQYDIWRYSLRSNCFLIVRVLPMTWPPLVCAQWWRNFCCFMIGCLRWIHRVLYRHMLIFLEVSRQPQKQRDLILEINMCNLLSTYCEHIAGSQPLRSPGCVFVHAFILYPGSWLWLDHHCLAGSLAVVFISLGIMIQWNQECKREIW